MTFYTSRYRIYRLLLHTPLVGLGIRHFWKHDTTAIFGSIFGIALLWIALAGSFALATEGPLGGYSQAFCINRNMMLTLFGAVAGGITAMLMSPLGEHDEKRLNSLTNTFDISDGIRNRNSTDCSRGYWPKISRQTPML